jgi:hypothetical protein
MFNHSTGAVWSRYPLQVLGWAPPEGIRGVPSLAGFPFLSLPGVVNLAVVLFWGRKKVDLMGVIFILYLVVSFAHTLKKQHKLTLQRNINKNQAEIIPNGHYV